jgi:hypothetical protein
MVPLNKLTRKSKLTYQSIVLHIQQNGKTLYPHWSLPIIIDNMLIELIHHLNGEAPVAIPTTFENTKFPSVAEKIKNLVISREEVLAAHKLHGGKDQIKLCSI